MVIFQLAPFDMVFAHNFHHSSHSLIHKRENKMTSTLAQNWRTCGIEPGDLVLVHSSLKRTIQTFNTTPQAVMGSFLEAAGPDGTVLFPLFNFDFTKGTPFDIRSTPSQMGALTEAARQYPGRITKRPSDLFVRGDRSTGQKVRRG
jgi:aminoglycoside N3'-acetyltransferase